ncbi:MAG TPA: hypothetical protein VMM93_14695, partial [Vicinamibacterales bacterium]|nr:hypothetical protein [Vicinamibacterales bacterium]
MRTLLGLMFAVSFTAGCGGSTSAQGGQAPEAPLPIERVDQLDVRRLWSGSEPNFYVASPSPDGRLVTEIDWSTGDLAVRDLETGALRRVTNKGSWGDSGDFAEYSVFSPDGERIAYSWFSSEALGYEVRTIRADGSDMQVVMPKNPQIRYAAVEDWSRDGRSILLTVFKTDRTSEIGVLTIQDGSYRMLKSSEFRNPIVAAFSPDGRYVAFDFPVGNDEANRDIFIVPVAGGRETTLVSGPGHDLLLGWLPDGQGILYRTRTAESRALFALAVRDGRPAGAPQLVRPDAWQVQPLGFSRDAFFYGVDVEGRQVHVAPIDLTGSRPLGPGRAISDPTHSRGWEPAWSPDGQMIAHLATPAGLGRRLELRSATGELRRHFPLPVTFNPRKLDWLPDGSGVLLYGLDPQGHPGIHRFDLADGTTRVVVPRAPNEPATPFFTISRDGGTIYYRRPVGLNAALVSHEIVARDVRTGDERSVRKVQAGRGIAVSPDGKWLAYTDEDMKQRVYKVMIAPVSGGEPREVYRPAGRVIDNNWRLNWAPDGRSLVVFDMPADRTAGVWQIPIDGSAPRLLLDR